MYFKVKHLIVYSILLCTLLPGWSFGNENNYLLVGYSFDDELIEVGPDTYQIFKNNANKVALSSAYKFSGYRALKIQDTAHDGDFPELQGYFKTLFDGKLFFHFALMVADTNERFNIALAGKSHFRMEKHGIGFWIDNIDGTLRHYVDNHPVDLFPLTPFLWYQIDLSYDIGAGEYDLIINNEYGDNLVSLKHQKNAVNSPGSTVNMFSFIGDLGDRGNASYYVDDIMIYSQDDVLQDKLVAPGRRKLFIDSWDDYHIKLYGSIQCIPGVKAIDFGIDTDTFFDLVKQGHLDLLNRLLEKEWPEIKGWKDNNYLHAIYTWQKGCGALKNKQWQLAIDFFRKAHNLVPNGRIYSMSLALAYTGAGKYQQADNLLAGMQGDWMSDKRLAVAYAMTGITRNDTHSATEWLSSLAFDTYRQDLLEFIEPLHAGLIDKNMIARLKNYAPDDWPSYLQQAIISEQYYFALLWEKRYEEAFSYAIDIIAKLTTLDIQSSKWNERAADAAFYNKTYHDAIDYYQMALKINNSCYVNYLKLADVYHLTGDVSLEREFRQRVYGKFDDAY